MLDRPLAAEDTQPPVGDPTIAQLADVVSRWKEFKSEMQASEMRKNMWNDNMRLGYPTWSLTARFGEYLLTSRCTRDLASARAGRPPLTGRAAAHVKVMLARMRRITCGAIFSE